MKFLVLAKPKSGFGPQTPPEAYKAAHAYFKTRLENGLLDCAYTFVPAGGIGIANSESAEQLWAELISYPLYSGFDWEVQPLADILVVLEKAAGG